MSQNGENNQRKRKQTDSPSKATMFHNFINTISTFIRQPLNDWLRKRRQPECSDHVSDQISEEMAPPSKKRKCGPIDRFLAPREIARPHYEIETVADCNEDNTHHGYDSNEQNSEPEETLNLRKRRIINDDDSVATPSKSFRSDVNSTQLAHYNSLSSTNLHERARQIMTSISPGTIQGMNRENRPALNHNYSVDRSMSVHRPFPYSHQLASRRANYYKTRDLYVPTQASIMLIKNNNKRKITALPSLHTSNAESEQAGPSGVPRLSDQAGPSKKVGPTEVAGPSKEVGPTEVAGPSNEVGPTEVAGPSKEVGSTEVAGPSNEVGLTEVAGPSKEVGPTEVAGPSKEVGPTIVAGPSNEVGPTEVAGPSKEVGPTEVAGPSKEVGPTEVAGPSNEVGPTEVACPCEEANPSELAGPSVETEPNGVPGSSGGVPKTINLDEILTITEESERSDINKVGEKNQPDNAFTKIILSSSEKWQCPICLVRNLQSLTKCGCCGGLKPGSQQSIQQNKAPKFNFGIQSAVRIGFKNIPPLQSIPKQISSAEESPASQPIVSPEMSPTSTTYNTSTAAICVTPEPTTALNPAANSEPTAASSPVASLAFIPEPLTASSPIATPAYIPASTFAPISTPSPTAASISSSMSTPNTHSSITLGNGYNENMKFVFGVPSVNMNTCRMQIPNEMKLLEIGTLNNNNFFSSTKPCVNIFGSGPSQGNNLFKSDATSEMYNTFSTPTFEQPAPRPPAPGPVFNFGQLQTQPMQAQTQPMQTLIQPMQAQTQPMQIQTQTQLASAQTSSVDATIAQRLGLQSQQLQPSHSGVYNFSGNQTVPQFNIGSSPVPSPTTRKIRKAVRRSNVR